MTLDEAQKRADEVLRAFIQRKEYFHETLSAIEPEVDRVPFILQLVSKQADSEKAIRVVFTIHKFFDPEEPPQEVLDAVGECLAELKKHPELAPFEFVTRLRR